MVNLIKSECYKLRKDQMFNILVILLIALSIAFPILELLDGRELDKAIDGNTFYTGNILSVNLEIIMRIIPIIFAGFFVSSEYSTGTMKSLVASGHHRIKIYLAKLLALTVGVVIISLVLPFVMTAANAVYFGTAVLPELDFFLKTVGLIALFAAAFASIIATFAFLFTDSGKTIGFLVIFFIFNQSILDRMSERITFLEPIARNSVFVLIFDIYQIHEVSNERMFTLIAVPVITFIFFAILGIIIFRRKEIK